MRLLLLIYFFILTLSLALLVSCSPGEVIYTHEGVALRIRQPQKANTPATLELISTNGMSLNASTGTTEPQSPAAIREASRKSLIWIGAGMILLGVVIGFLLKWPLVGSCIGLSGVALIGFHQYPWIALAVAILLSAAVAIYLGYTIAERTFSPPPLPKPHTN